MSRFSSDSTEKLGKAPGALVFLGEQKEERSSIEVITYNPDQTARHKEVPVVELQSFMDPGSTCWVNLSGIHDLEVIKKVGETFDLHVLLQEDIANTYQRPKYEEFEKHIFLVLKMLHYDKNENRIEHEQLCLVVGEGYLLTFQETREDVFDAIRERLIRPTTKIRYRKSDYLAYVLMDAVADNYIVIIEQFGERIENLEEELIADPRPGLLETIYAYKREINFLRKTIRPVRELVIEYEKAAADLLEEQTGPYVKDLVDHVTYAAEAIETYQVMLNDLLNLYQTGVDNRLNEIVRILTIFSVIFIPLTFIAGIYGTNFKYFPELEYRYAYPVFWTLLVIVAVVMVIYFRRKKWL